MRDLVKDIVSDAYIEARRFFRRGNASDSPSLRKHGFAFQGGLISLEQCERLRLEVDSALGRAGVNVWRDSLDSDKRIYGFETICPGFQDVFSIDRLRREGEAYLGHRISSYFALAARLDAAEDNVGSGGGWHRDSAFSHQFKVIVYLTDVNEENGPFQYIPGSHRSIAKYRACGLQGLSRTRFTPEDIKKFPATQTFLGRAGDALYVDTRGVHRGCPIRNGSRYAITFYFWTKPPIGKFNDLLQADLSFF